MAVTIALDETSAGVATGSFYTYFKSKEEIFKEVTPPPVKAPKPSRYYMPLLSGY